MIPYILHVAVLISVCLLFYKALLQRETFYRLNRAVLIFCLALSYAIPFIPIPRQWALRSNEPVAINEPAGNTDNTAAAAQRVNAVQNPQQVKPSPAVTERPNAQAVVTPAPPTATKAANNVAINTTTMLQRYVKYVVYLYWIGVAAFALNLLLQLVVLLYQAYTKPFVRDGKFRIVELSGDKAPCSFGNNIFINPEKYDWDTYNQILIHEKVHIQQRHSFDILLAELVLVLQWFNPFAWAYRSELENNLEFLTDDAVLDHSEVERSSYQMSLLKVSTPHLSLGITTNYNQSLLKKRIVMMNAKKSNINTMWKYFFLVPLLGCLACALNNPSAYAMGKVNNNGIINKIDDNTDHTEGAWFATIKNDKIHMEFKGDDDDHNWSNSATFMVSEFSSLPKDQKGEFTLKREAGAIMFNGKFDGDQGYGHYKFTEDKSFNNFLKQQGITEIEDNDSFAFFLLNVKKDYVTMLQRNGYKDISKHNLISMAALKVDEAYIRMWKDNGYPNLSPNELVSGKALHIDNAYVADIRKAGYKDLSFNQLISFKAQHITGEYINGIRKAKLKDGKTAGEDNLPTANELSSYKAMNVDSAYVRSMAAAGYKGLAFHDLTTMKALHITPEFIKSYKALGYINLTVNQLATLKSLNITPEVIRGYQALGFKDLTVNNLSTLKSLGITAEFIKSYEAIGYKNLSVNNLSTLKSLGITPAYVKSFEALGYKNLTVNQLSSLKALNITEEYIRSFEAVGYKNISINDLTSLKALGITPDFVKGYKDIGFTDIPIHELSSLKAMGVTPAYITEMKGKGFNSDNLRKYIQLKSTFN
jgi:hypothetical protein